MGAPHRIQKRSWAFGAYGAGRTCSENPAVDRCPATAGVDVNRTLRIAAVDVAVGRRPCENSGTFSHGPISFAFSSPETVQRRKNYGNLRSARPVGKFCGVLTRPRRIQGLQGSPREGPESARYPSFHCERKIAVSGRHGNTGWAFALDRLASFSRSSPRWESSSSTWALQHLRRASSGVSPRRIGPARSAR
jgi:hypothetical protein